MYYQNNIIKYYKIKQKYTMLIKTLMLPIVIHISNTLALNN